MPPYCEFIAEELFPCSNGQRVLPGLHLGFCQITTNSKSDGKRHPWLETVISVTWEKWRDMGHLSSTWQGRPIPHWPPGWVSQWQAEFNKHPELFWFMHGVFSEACFDIFVPFWTDFAHLEIRSCESGKNCNNQLSFCSKNSRICYEKRLWREFRLIPTSFLFIRREGLPEGFAQRESPSWCAGRGPADTCLGPACWRSTAQGR